MKKNYNTDEVFELLKQFMKEYESYYPESVIQTLQYKLAMFDLDPEICGGMNQIYDELGILENDDNFYIAFAQYLNQTFSLNRHVIEIGSGFFPTLGKQIAKIQTNLKSGTLTVYDPCLIERHYDGITLCKKPFTGKEQINGNELLIGFFPCEACSTIIQTSLKYDLDFSVQLCGCLHDQNFRTIKSYHDAFIYQIKKRISNDRKLQIDYLDPKYNISYPILSSIKVKQL